MRYHNSPNGPRVCHAKTAEACPYGAQGFPHFNTREDAQAAYDKSMAEKFGAFETLKKTTGEKARQKAYSGADRVLATARTVVASEPVRKAVRAVETVKSVPRRARLGVLMAKSRFRNAVSSLQERSSSLMRNMKVRAIGTVDAVRGNIEQSRIAYVENFERGRRESEYGRAQRQAYGAYRAEQRRARLQEVSERVSSMARIAKDRVLDKEFGREKTAATLRLGDRMSGGKVVGLTAGNDVVSIITMDDFGKTQHMQFQSNQVVATRWTFRSHVASIKNSPFFQRARRAGALQRQAFQTLFNVGAERNADARAFDARVGTMTKVGANRGEYARGA